MPFLYNPFLQLLDIFIEVENIDFLVLITLFFNSFPMMMRGIYNDFCIANEFTKDNRLDSTIFCTTFFSVILISLFLEVFLIWYVAVAHLMANILCVIFMKKTIKKKLSYFSDRAS